MRSSAMPASRSAKAGAGITARHASERQISWEFVLSPQLQDTLGISPRCFGITSLQFEQRFVVMGIC